MDEGSASSSSEEEDEDEDDESEDEEDMRPDEDSEPEEEMHRQSPPTQIHQPKIVPQPPPLPPKLNEVIVKKDYDPKGMY